MLCWSERGSPGGRETWWSFDLCPASVQRRWRERREEYMSMAWESGASEL